MIVGNGLLARRFKAYATHSNVVIFASGVSNSNETNQANFLREEKKLKTILSQSIDQIIVYFSSCDVIYAKTLNKAYYFHKLKMESLVKEHAKFYYIFRLPQVIGVSNNKNALINFFIISILENRELDIWENAYKNLIDIDDIYTIVDYYIRQKIELNSIVNVINPNLYSVVEIVETIEKLLNKKAKQKRIARGFKPEYEQNNNISRLNIDFNNNYLEKAIQKCVVVDDK